MLIPALRRSSPGAAPSQPWSPAARAAAFFAVGLYGGAFQAGVGVVLVFALAHAGSDLVRANAVKMVVVTALTAIALPVFWLGGQIAWAPATGAAARR
jgi:uncharacterized membrane protein YfcA